MKVPGNPVLLVEDNPDDALLMRRAWRKAGICNQLLHAFSGVEAVDFLREADACDLALLLLDTKMPRMDGFETLQWVRRQGRHAKLPVIKMSASTLESDMARAKELGATLYCVKPGTFAGLVEQLQGLQTRFGLS